MGESKTKKLELNTKLLENFEKIMSIKLDEIEELKITSLDEGSKLLNIISLCANVKTLILEGDSRLNSDRVLSNIFKPEKLESLILNRVKLPTVRETLKKYTNLKMLSLNDIRFGDCKEFLEKGIAQPEKVEIIHISNVDLFGHSIKILERFTQIKYLNLEQVRNFRLDDFSFLKNNKNILKIQIKNNQIPITALNHLLKCNCSKNVKVNLTNEIGKVLKNAELEISENVSKITLTIQDFDENFSKVDLHKFTNLTILIHEPVANMHALKLLKKLKAEIQVAVKDFSCLNAEQARKIKNTLKIEYIQFWEEKIEGKYDILAYIDMRIEMEDILKKIPNNATDVEKFLIIYRTLGQEFEVVPNDQADRKNKKYTALQMAQLLQNCLKSVQINSAIITGDDLENEKKHTWNQVEIEHQWYHVDLSLDMENIKKNKAEYCLLGDKNFLQTHCPKAGQNHYCEEDFNVKLINVFFKTGLLKESLFESYVELIVEKIKKLFTFNKKQEILALPEAKSNKNDPN